MPQAVISAPSIWGAASTTWVQPLSRQTVFVPVLFSCAGRATIPLMLFQIPGQELPDAEIAAILRDIIAGAGRCPRQIELNFASICADISLTDCGWLACS